METSRAGYATNVMQTSLSACLTFRIPCSALKVRYRRALPRLGLQQAARYDRSKLPLLVVKGYAGATVTYTLALSANSCKLLTLVSIECYLFRALFRQKWNLTQTFSL